MDIKKQKAFNNLVQISKSHLNVQLNKKDSESDIITVSHYGMNYLNHPRDGRGSIYTF